jgi:hypothetical protein
MLNLGFKFFYLFNILYLFFFVSYFLKNILLYLVYRSGLDYFKIGKENIDLYSCHLSALSVISYITIFMIAIYLSVINNLFGKLHNFIKSLIVKDYIKSEDNLLLNIKEDVSDIVKYLNNRLDSSLAFIKSISPF